MAEKIIPFNAQHLEAICRVLADTEKGLTGTQIGYMICQQFIGHKKSNLASESVRNDI